jgi:exodeoxyribonuclease VIII
MIDFAEGVWDVGDAMYYACRKTVSHSMLKVFGASPNLYQQRFVSNDLTDDETTRTLLAGRALHVAALEPSKFRQQFAVKPEDAKRNSKKGLEIYDAFVAANEGKEIITQDEAAMIVGICKAIRANAKAAELLYEGEAVNEQAIRWIDVATGIRCRAKMDRFGRERLTIVDIKSTTDATPDEFTRSAYNYGYHTQASYYVHGVAKAFGVNVNDVQFVFVACAKEPPYEVGIYELDDDFLSLGAYTNAKRLRDLRECYETNHWLPGWSSEITKLSAPYYALRKQRA